MINEHFVFTNPILPPFQEPHSTYLEVANKTISELTCGLNCYLYAIYYPATFEFLVNISQSKNISKTLAISVENKIKESVLLFFDSAKNKNPDAK